jgi:hypothetical protein
MRRLSRLAGLLALGAILAFTACGGGSADLSPVAPSAAASVDSGTPAASGNGPGAPATTPPGFGPGDGTCDHDCTGAGDGPGAGPADDLCGAACTGPVGPDPADLGEVLGLALQEEHKAEMLYRSVLEDFGSSTLPFATVADAESRHLTALERLFARREWAPPASEWTTDRFPRFDSLKDACAAGVAAELEDAALYDRYLVRDDLPRDVATVFTNLRAASLENHLPAFEACR